MKLPLKHPFDFKGRTIGSITLRRARSKDMIRIADHLPTLQALAPKIAQQAAETAALDGDQADAPVAATVPVDVSGFDGKAVIAMIEIVASLSDLSIEEVEEMDFEDLGEIASRATDFL